MNEYSDRIYEERQPKRKLHGNQSWVGTYFHLRKRITPLWRHEWSICTNFRSFFHISMGYANAVAESLNPKLFIYHVITGTFKGRVNNIRHCDSDLKRPSFQSILCKLKFLPSRWLVWYAYLPLKKPWRIGTGILHTRHCALVYSTLLFHTDSNATPEVGFYLVRSFAR